MDHENNYVKVADDSGQEYYCPMASTESVRERGVAIDDECVETDVTQRYSGNIRVVGRQIS